MRENTKPKHLKKMSETHIHIVWRDY